MSDKQLNGSQRVLLDKVISDDECRELQRLSNVSCIFKNKCCFRRNGVTGAALCRRQLREATATAGSPRLTLLVRRSRE